MIAVELYFDGGCSLDGGHGYGSFEFTLPSCKVKETRFTLPGHQTCNTAEYFSLIKALESLRESASSNGINPREVFVDIFSDSMLLVKQVNRKWRIRKDSMAILCGRVRQLLRPFATYRIRWASRETNVARFGH